MLMKACTPIHRPMPWVIRPANTRSRATAWRPICDQMRRVSQKKSGDDCEHADEAELLADHREQEVGVRLGQVVQLLDASLPRPWPKISPRPKCDQRMRQLVGT